MADDRNYTAKLQEYP